MRGFYPIIIDIGDDEIMTVKNDVKMAQEKWENLTLRNGFIFSKVMLNEEICKRVIRLTTDLPTIDYIEYVETEKTIDLRHDSKGVRLDVFLKDDKGKAYNIELQTIDTKELPERARYYQSMVDMDLLKKGENYVDLTDSYVIFICMEDIFKRGLARYTFKNRCMELDDLLLNDGTTKIFLNSKGKFDNMSKDARGFLNYLEGNFEDNEFIKLLETEVAKVKSDKKLQVEYMSQHVQETLNFRKGREEGERNKAIEMARKLISDNMPFEIIERYTGLELGVIETLARERIND